MGRLQNAVQQLKSKNQPILDNTDRALGLLPLNEAVTTAATHAEMAICVAYNENQGSKKPLEDAGIPLTNWKKVDETVVETGKKIAKELGNTMGDGLIHSGAGLTGIKNYYASGRDVTPKADFTSSSKPIYVSLKKSGDAGDGAQLMSAKSGEATGVFEAAVKHYQEREKVDLSKDKAFKNAMDILSKQMAATARNDMYVKVGKAKTDFGEWYTTQSSRRKEVEKIMGSQKKNIVPYLSLELSALGATKVTKDVEDKLKKLLPKNKVSSFKLPDVTKFNKLKDEYVKDDTYQVGNVKVNPEHLKTVAPEKLTNPALKKQIVDVIQTSVDSKPWQTALTDFFNQNEGLKKWMVYEAASGLYKFTGEFSKGTEYEANQSAVANKILVFTDTGVKSEQSVLTYSMNNPQLVNKISISYKGSGTSRYIKLGISAAYEHELPMLTEELKKLERQYLLNEGVFQRFKDRVGKIGKNIFNDIKKKTVAFLTQVKKIVKDFYERIIKRFFVKLYELVKEGIYELMDALGLKIIIDNEDIMKTPSW